MCLFVDWQAREPDEHNKGRGYLWKFFISLVIGLAQIAFGFSAHSIAVVGDALHTLFHVFGDMLSVVAEYVVKLFGLKNQKERRVRAIFGLLSALLLIVISVFIFIEGVRRWYNPVEIAGYLMFIGGSIGFVGNIVNMFVIHSGVGKIHQHWSIMSLFKEDEDETHIWSHRDIFFDCADSLAVCIGAVIFLVTGINRIDSILSFIISFFIFFSTVYTLYTSTFKNLK